MRGAAVVAVWAALVRTLGVVEALRAPFLTKYSEAARALLSGALPPERWLDFSPFYLGLSVVIDAVGLPVRESLLVLQALAGVAASLVAFALARRWAGLAAGVAAGLFVGSARMVVVGGALLEPEIFLGIVLLTGVWLLARMESPEIRPPALPVVAAGVCFAVAALIRPNALMVPVFLVGLAFVFHRHRLHPALLATAVSGVGLLLGLALWLGPRVSPTEWSALMSPGQVFYQGNARDASGFGLHHPVSVAWATERVADGRPDFEHQAYRDVARAARNDCLGPAAAERFWRSNAWEAIRERPQDALQRAGSRFLGTVHRRQVWDVHGAARLETRLAWPAPVEMPVLLSLALVAFVLPDRRRLLPLVPLLILPFLTSTVFFASGRHRLLLDLGLAVAAGVGAAKLWERLRRRTTWTPLQTAAVLGVLGIGGLLPFLPVDAVERNRTLVALDGVARQNVHQALAAWDRGETARAENLAARAVVLDSGLEQELPPDLRNRPGFRTAARELSRDLVLSGQDGVTPRAAAALVQFAGCAELDAVLEIRMRQGPPIDAAFRPAVAVLARGCALRTGKAVLPELAPDAQTLRGHALDAAAQALHGASLEEALDSVPSSYDDVSARIALAEALRLAGRPTLAEEIEVRMEDRLRRVRSHCSD